MAIQVEFRWSSRAPGVWASRMGEDPGDTLLSIAGVEPRSEALKDMGDAQFPFAGEVKVEQVKGRMVLRFPLSDNEKLYGLGLQFQTVDQRNKAYHLKVDHYGGKDNGRTHAPCPFYVSSKGYGVFINTPRYVSIYAGSANRKDSPNPPEAKDRNRDRMWKAHPDSDYVEVAVEAAGVEVIVFGGPEILDVVRRYNLYCGGGCLPPKWGLGIWKRVPSLYTDKQVMNTVKEFEDRDFPLDVVGLEPGWHSKSYPCTYEWDQERFPEPGTLCSKLMEKGLRVNLWENPYVSPEAPIYEKLLPLSGTHNVWCGIVPDYTLEEAADVLKEQHRRTHVDIGVSGYKVDECDGYDRWLWPDHAEFPSGHTGEEMRQTYGLQLQKLTTEIFKEKNRRTYGLVRASNSGGVSFPYVIYNDYYKFDDYITALCNSGFSGVLWTPEVRGAKTAEEWVRRCQVVCFSPMAMINSWASQMELWSFPEVEEALREVMKLRKRMLPYLYSAFARYHFEGIPPFRAFAMENGILTAEEGETDGGLDDTENPYAVAAAKDVKDQFMVGDCLMVAPMLPEQEERDVLLPRGNWFDFYTGEWVGNGQVIKVKPGLEKIPLYVKDGGMIPLLGENNTLWIQCYGDKEGRFLLYDDDGETYDYEKGKYNLVELATTRDAEGKRCGKAEIKQDKVSSSYGGYQFRFMSGKK